MFVYIRTHFCITLIGRNLTTQLAGSPQGNWRWNSNSIDSRRIARAPRRACLQATPTKDWAQTLHCLKSPPTFFEASQMQCHDPFDFPTEFLVMPCKWKVPLANRKLSDSHRIWSSDKRFIRTNYLAITLSRSEEVEMILYGRKTG